MSTDGYKKWCEYRKANPLPRTVVDYCGVKLTFRQHQVIRIIENYINKNMTAPSYREIAKVMGMSSTNSLKNHLHILKRKGVIDWTPHKSRGIRLLKYTPVLIRNDMVDDVRELLELQEHNAMIVSKNGNKKP